MLYTNSKVNKNNTLYKFDNELTRYNIHNEINIKLPSILMQIFYQILII